MAGRWSGKAADSSWCYDLPDKAQQAVKDMLAPASKVPDAQKQVWPPPVHAACVLSEVLSWQSFKAQHQDVALLQCLP